MNLYRLLSALIDYPTAEPQAVGPQMRAAVADHPDLAPDERDGLLALVDRVTEADLLELQEAYSALFDLGGEIHLHVTHFEHGDTQERGQKLVAMDQFYRLHGYVNERFEVPDYLPLMLEFAGEVGADAEDMIAEFGPIYADLEAKLAAKDSPYAAAFTVLKNRVGEPVPA